MTKPTRPQPPPAPPSKAAARHPAPQAWAHRDAPVRPTPAAAKCLQPKAATPYKPTAGPVKAAPVPPPPYRPLPAPKVLQRKPAVAQPPPPGQPPRRPVAPPVYRPGQSPTAVQPKTLPSQPRKPPAAPPVYRPEQKKIVQPKTAFAPQARGGPKAPAVYRPQPVPKVLQKKSAHPVAPAAAATRARFQPGAARGGNNAVQLIRKDPVLTGAATQTGVRQALNPDTVATGPAHLWEYAISINAPQADRVNAMSAIRTQYVSIGAGYSADKYISKENVTKLAQSNNLVLDYLYALYVTQGYIPTPLANKVRDETNAPAKKALKQKYVIPLLGSREILDELLNKAGLTLIDPVKTVIESQYTGGTLTTTVLFTEGQKGYVTQVRDTHANIDAAIADRPNYAGEFPIPDERPVPNVENMTYGQLKAATAQIGAEDGGVGSYSNVHHEATDEDLATQIGRLGQATTKLRQEEGVDAITKYIAEGGRWNAVSALGTSLKNNSLFFAAKGGGYRAVELRQLWKRWIANFKGGYGIPDNKVVTEITKDPKPAWVLELPAMPAATGSNYNLDTSAVR